MIPIKEFFSKEEPRVINSGDTLPDVSGESKAFVFSIPNGIGEGSSLFYIKEGMTKPKPISGSRFEKQKVFDKETKKDLINVIFYDESLETFFKLILITTYQWKLISIKDDECTRWSERIVDTFPYGHMTYNELQKFVGDSVDIGRWKVIENFTQKLLENNS